MKDAELRRLLKENADETRRQFERMDARFDQVDARLDGVDARLDGVDARFDRTDATIEERFHELHRYMGVIAEEFDGKLELGRELTQMVDEKLERRTAELQENMEQGFAETKALIQFTYRNLEKSAST
jgi:hypothetical protein